MVPVRAPAPYLAAALASIAADDPHAEVVVVENGTRSLRPGDVRGAELLRLGAVGRSAARNAGVAAVSAPLVAFLDADDESLPGRLARQRAALEAAPDAALAFGRVEIVDGGGARLDAWTERIGADVDRLLARGPTFEALLETCPIYTSATVVRRDAFLTAGGYDVRLDAYEDLDLYLRLARAGRVVALPGPPVTRYRLHGANTTSTELFAGAYRVAAKHLPGARGLARARLLERQVDSLWGLGDYRGARAHAVRAAIASPRLLAHRRFAKRLAGSLAPVRILERRR